MEKEQYVRSLNNQVFETLLALVNAGFPLQYEEEYDFLLKEGLLQSKTQFLDGDQYQRGIYLTEKGAEILEYIKKAKENKLKI